MGDMGPQGGIGEDGEKVRHCIFTERFLEC